MEEVAMVNAGEHAGGTLRGETPGRRRAGPRQVEGT